MHVGVSNEVLFINLASQQQFADQRHYEQAICSRPNSDPFIRNGRIPGSYWIYGDEFRAPGFQLTYSSFYRVGIMVLSDAEHKKVFGVIPIRLAKFPKGAADRIEAACRHVDGTKAAMGRKIWRPELLGPPTGQRLALIPTGKEC